MSESFDCVIAGAGVIGLAIGRRLALAGFDVAVVEAEGGIGVHTSSRNSEVIHAGIYYPKDSLKARFCVAGKAALYRYCNAKGVRHRRIGKFIVATTTAEEQKLEGIERRARDNGVTDLEFLTAKEISKQEPRVRASAALFSPSTGIIDSHEYMLALQADLEGTGGYVIFTLGCRR